MIGIYLLGPYLLGAVYMDLKTNHVRNQYIVLGYLTGLFYNVQEFGILGLRVFVWHAFWPVVLLYVLFMVRGLGAGDIKLISVMSTFLVPSKVVHILIASVFIGAVISIGKILLHIGKQGKGGSVCRSTIRLGSYIHYTTCILGAMIYACVKEGLYG